MDSIIFIRLGGKGYFKFRNCNYELIAANIKYVKRLLEYPCKIEFYNYDKKIIRLILNEFIDENMVIKGHKLEEENCYEIIVYKSKYQKLLFKKELY